MKDIAYYIHCFKKLRRDNKKGGAPHKPILLLSIIEHFDRGLIKERLIYITAELVSSFKTHWAELITTEHHCIFALPFYHLSSEPFWKLVANPGCEKWIEAKASMRSFSNLTTAVDFASIDEELFFLLSDKESRDIFALTLLDTYFPESKKKYGVGEGTSYLDDLSKQMAEEDAEEYKRRILLMKQDLDQNSFEEEIFVRSGVFKREIPKIYDNTCAISGLRIDATVNVSMIDACHIIPFSESYDDTIRNGIALCPNLHRAFDRGLISINQDYHVLISPKFIEPNESLYSIVQFADKQISLPVNSKFYPAQENLVHHRKRFGFPA